MHKMAALLAVATLFAATLAGCNSGNRESVTPEPRASIATAYPRAEPEAASEAAETPVPDSGPSFGDKPMFKNEWSKKQLRDYMIYQGANSLEGFSQGSPERNILAVTNPEEGVVRFEVADLDYETNGWFIEGLAVNFMSWTGCAADDVDAVIVETVGGGERVTLNGCGVPPKQEHAQNG